MTGRSRRKLVGKLRCPTSKCNKHEDKRARNAETAYRARGQVTNARKDCQAAKEHFRYAKISIKEGVLSSWRAIRAGPAVYEEKAQQRKEKDEERKRQIAEEKKKMWEEKARKKEEGEAAAEETPAA